MNTKLGSDLNLTEKKIVLGRYVNRFTADHTPPWARESNAPVQFASDADWLAHTEFRITKAGRLCRRAKYCYSSPTWPLGAH